MREKIKKLLPKELLFVLKNLRAVYLTLLFYLFRFAPIQNNRIVLCNVWALGDNTKYILEKLREEKNIQGLDLDLIFITNHPSNYEKLPGVTLKKTNSISAVFSLVTAKVWVDSNRKENFTRKRKGQFYIQTWHGGIALKKIEKDYQEVLGKSYVKNAKKDSKMTDLYISNSNFCTQMYINSFWYEGNILECGSPRNDSLLNPSQQVNKIVREKLSLKEGQKLALYAPTYRDSTNTEPYEMDYEKIVWALEQRFGGEFILLVRLHPLVAFHSSTFHFSKKVRNGTHYPDIYELMQVAEVLITDYSNIMFEFSYLRKPVFLYAKDKIEYEEDRGFYFEYNSLPYPIAMDEFELLETIKNYEAEKEQTKVSRFFEEIQLYESGTATKQVVQVILKTIS